MSLAIELLGALAGLLTTVAFLPQAARTFRSRSVKDLSLATYLCLVTGVFLWMCYGILLERWPIILFNAIALVIQVAILVMKLRYDKADPPS